MLHELMQKKNLAKNLSENCGLGSIPAFENRESWENLPESAKRYFRETADELKGKRHIALPATLYMDFARIGVAEKLFVKMPDEAIVNMKSFSKSANDTD